MVDDARDDAPLPGPFLPRFAVGISVNMYVYLCMRARTPVYYIYIHVSLCEYVCVYVCA